MSAPTLSSARAVADLTGGIILAAVEIAATPERVFRAIGSEEIAGWWGSAETYRVTRWTGDVRPGGWWRSEGMAANGQAFAVGGEYLEVAPPLLLVHTWRYEHRPADVTTVRYQIEAIPRGSRVTVRHEGFTDSTDCDSHSRGWEHVLGWLQNHVNPSKAGNSLA
jgi:uncharacterized protein YndB with AHSA1/START domain